jgi:hypothetical protein
MLEYTLKYATADSFHIIPNPLLTIILPLHMRFEVLPVVKAKAVFWAVAVWTCIYPEDGSNIFLRNAVTHLQVHKASQLVRPLPVPAAPSYRVYNNT